MTEPDHSVSLWLSQVKAGDGRAAQLIWDRYFGPLVRLASQRLRTASRRMSDEEDVAVSAFDALFRGAADGRFSALGDRDDLWQVLVMLTERKAIDHARRATADRRGGGKVRGESIFGGEQSHSLHGSIRQIASHEPTPEFTAMMGEELDRRLAALADSAAQEIALLKLAGHTNDEIAAQLAISVRSVERKLNLIRRMWEETSEHV